MSESIKTKSEIIEPASTKLNTSPSADDNKNEEQNSDKDADNPQPRHATPQEVSRREFLGKVGLALSGVAAIGVAVPVVGFVLGPLFQAPPPEWRKVGAVESFKIGETTQVKFTNSAPHQWAGAVGESAAWLRREDEQSFKVFSVNCTHLGCPVEWKPEATLFFCPCHGGVYYKDGKVAAGPPPHPLPQYPVRVKDGQVEVQTAAIPLTVIGDQLLGK